MRSRMISRTWSVVPVSRGRRFLFGIFAIAVAMIPLGPSAAKGGESPRLKEVLSVLGYANHDAAKAAESFGDPATRVKAISELPVKLLSTSMRVSPKRDRKVDEPWIRHGFEIIYGDGSPVERTENLMLRFDYVIFDESMKKVDSKRMGVQMTVDEGDSPVTEVSQGFQLQSPMRSGTEACLVLGRKY